MSDKKKDVTREPFIHITKRKEMPWYRAWLIRGIAIVTALLLCALVTGLTTGLNPLKVYTTMWAGAFGSPRKMWVLGKEIAVLLCVSLALAPAFRMKFWNLGGEGQVLIGALATAACMLKLGKTMDGPLLVLIMFVAALGAGAIFAAIPAIFKAKWNTNETLFTLMMNYVAIQLVAYYVILWEVPKGSGKIGIINQSSQTGWLPNIAGKQYLLIILAVAIVTVLMHVYLKYSKHGYELAVVGESVQTAKYVGIKVDRVIIRTLVLSGAVCGLAGFLMVAGSDHTITTTLAGGRGFLGIMVAWLAKFNPIGMILSTFLLVFMSRGGGEISAVHGLNHAFGDILTGIILFFIIGSEFFITYQLHFRKSRGKEQPAREEEAHV